GRPAATLRSERVNRFARDQARMVVLDQQHVLELVEDLAKVAGALSGQAGAEGVLPARRQNEGTGAGGKRLLERVRLRSVVVDGDGRQRRRGDAVGGEVSLRERDEPVDLVREWVSARTGIEASQR